MEKVLKNKRKETLIFVPLESLYGAHTQISQQVLMELEPGTLLGIEYIEMQSHPLLPHEIPSSEKGNK